MNKDDVRKGIAKSWALLKSLSLTEAFSNSLPMNASDDFISTAFDSRVTYEDLYLTGLRNVDYNILLKDFSYFQYSLTEDDHTRYAYYPNPFLGASHDAISELDELRVYVEEGAISVEDYLIKAAELRGSQHPPLLRYENAPRQYAEFRHPCSHFHLGHHDNNRWPIQRSLTPLAFTMLVSRHFYTDVWFGVESIDLFGKSQSPDDFLAAAKVDCRILGDDLFSKKESLLFSFG